MGGEEGEGGNTSNFLKKIIGDMVNFWGGVRTGCICHQFSPHPPSI